jgi:hypothetical protein
MNDYYEFKHYCNIKTDEVEYNYLKENKLELINKYRNIKWDKAGCKIHYNTYNFLKKYCDGKLIHNYNKCYINIANDIDIPIRKQDFFHIILVQKFKKIFKSWFDNFGYIDENIFSIEVTEKTTRNKIYRTDMLIKINNKKYICIEFFENHHLILDDIEMIRENNRINNLLINNKRKDRDIVHVAVFWEKNLYDEEYFIKFRNHLVKLINNYKNIEDKKYWCINQIKKYVSNDKLSENLYNSYLDRNKLSIPLSDVTDIIKWKNETSKNKCLKKFIKYLAETKEFENNRFNINDNDLDFLENDNDLDFLENNNKEITNYYNNNLFSFNGFFEFINFIDSKYLIDIKEKRNLNQLNINIAIGFIDGIDERHELILNLKEKLIYGLNDY